MSENNDDNERVECSMNNDEANYEHLADPLVRDFINYSDSVDGRMMGMVNRRRNPSEIHFNSWERRGDYQELSSESDEEVSPNEDMLVNGSRCSAKIEELVKKFSTIELLREKENIKQAHENDGPKLSFSSERARQEEEEEEESEQKASVEGFFGRKRLRKKQRNMWKGKEGSPSDSEGTSEESDKEIDELVELMSSTSLIKIYDENISLPSEEVEILKTFLQPEEKNNPLESSNKTQRKKTVEALIDVFEDVPETETKDTVKEQSADDESVWKPNELCATFDGYDIDNQSSFHDWMLDEMLSKSLKTSSETELTVCSKCFSIHNDQEECVQE